MDKELFKKTEEKLYRYFRYKREILNSKRRIDFLQIKINEIDKSIRNVHKYINVDPYKNGTRISERVQTSSNGTSYVELEMIKEVCKLEKEQCNIMKSILKQQLKIREKEAYIRGIDTNIEMFSEEDKRFVELKYGDRKEMLLIATQLNLSLSTCYRRREDLVKHMEDYINLIK